MRSLTARYTIIVSFFYCVRTTHFTQENNFTLLVLNTHMQAHVYTDLWKNIWAKRATPTNKNNWRRWSIDRLGRISVTFVCLYCNVITLYTDENANNAPFTGFLVTTGPGCTYHQPVCNGLYNLVATASIGQYNPLWRRAIRRRAVGKGETGQQR